MNPVHLLWLELTDPRGELVCVAVALALALGATFSLAALVPSLRHDLPHTVARIRAGEASAWAWWRDLGPWAVHLALAVAVVGLWAWAPWPEAWDKASHFGLFGFALAHALALWGLRGQPGEWWGRAAYHQRHGLAPPTLVTAPFTPKAPKRSWAKKRKGKKRRR